MNALPPEIELADLWSGEGDTITFHVDPPAYGNPGSVTVWLSADSTNRYDIAIPPGVDDVTLTWMFGGDTLAEAIDTALAFARDLHALGGEA